MKFISFYLQNSFSLIFLKKASIHLSYLSLVSLDKSPNKYSEVGRTVVLLKRAE